MTNLYYIKNIGCDDLTKGLAIIPDEFWDIFQTTIENLNKNSTYCCMPEIEVYKIDENMIKEATKDDTEYDIMYLNGNKYVLNRHIPWKMRVIQFIKFISIFDLIFIHISCII